MIPLRRLWRRVQAPAEPVVSRELAASTPERKPVIHLHVDGASGLSVACGSRTIGRNGVAMWITDPYEVTCGACKRTRIYKTRTDPAAIPAAGTTRKQES